VDGHSPRRDCALRALAASVALASAATLVTAQTPTLETRTVQTGRTQTSSGLSEPETPPSARTSGRLLGSAGRAVSPLASAVNGSIPADRSELPADGRLTLEATVRLAIRHNLAVLLGEEAAEESRGFAAQSRSPLLPNVDANASQANLTANLAALGFDPTLFGGASSRFLIGPYDRFDARASLVQNVFNLSAIRGYQAGRAGVRVADLELELAHQEVVEAASLAYLDALAADRSVAQAQANLDLAQALLTLARDQHRAGIATGLDVTRAETREAQERVRVARARSDADDALSRLARIAGIPQDTSITLVDPLRFVPEALPPVSALVTEALQTRLEVRIAAEQQRRSALERRAAEAEQLPSLDVAADYGASGNTPTRNDIATRGVAVRLNVPVFNGGLTRGRIAVARSLERQAELQLGDVRGTVEQDVRLAVLAEATAAEQVAAADEQEVLAERQVRMARDRFAAGVASNIEVTEAQTALADARHAQVEALARYTAARIEVAAARGIVERFRW
jgi:outer membrane protein TolC